MQKLSDARSIIAIDPTSRGVAFVFFEKGRVLDWGERLRAGSSDEVLAVTRLIEACDAKVVIVEDPLDAACRRRPRIKNVLRSIVAHAGETAAVLQVARADVCRAWQERGVTNKEAAALAIAARFPELAASLPPRRKRGANEDPRVNIFDAASLAIHAFDSSYLVP